MTLKTAGFIGGSGTLATEFPPANSPLVERIVGEDIVFKTPYGESPPFSHFILVNGRPVLSCRMHGWRQGVTRRDASLQVFWTFRNAGVQQVLAEGGVGTLDAEILPGSLVIPDDYIDWSLRRDVSLTEDFLLVMRDPLCQRLRSTLAEATGDIIPDAVLARSGVYAVTDGRHFESRAEVRALKVLGADIVGQSLCPEVYLAREIGACYAGLHQVVNRAEGVGDDWLHEELKDIFFQRAPLVADLMMSALLSLTEERPCLCPTLRKETLLRRGVGPTGDL